VSLLVHVMLLHRMAGAESQSRLLALPDPCLLAVLHCCAADSHHSLFSAARAHPRLHHAAVLALSSIQAVVPGQQQLDSVMLYLGKDGKNVDAIHISSLDWRATLDNLPPSLLVSSLQLEGMSLQPGVLGAAAGVAALKQLQLNNCNVVGNNTAGLAEAFSQLLLGLEHLTIAGVYVDATGPLCFPTCALQQQQQQQQHQLTYLELAGIRLQGPDEDSPALQPLQALTALVDLRLHALLVLDPWITVDMLSGMSGLTCIDLAGGTDVEAYEDEAGDMVLEPGVLAGKTQLQHLRLACCKVLGGTAGVAQLLSHIQPLQQLTHLDLAGSLGQVPGEGTPPASTHAALTASSKLHHLGISECSLPAGVWQHMFPAGRQLPHLTSLDACCALPPASAPDGSRLVSCCPGLQDLNIRGLQSSKEQVAPLQGLSGLTGLSVCARTDIGVVPAVCQLTGLLELEVDVLHSVDPQLLQLTQLKQLTVLNVAGSDGYMSALGLPCCEV
jgi:hypothetical protein